MCLLEFNAVHIDTLHYLVPPQINQPLFHSQFIETSNLLLLEVAVSGICALLPILSMICYVGEGVRTKYLQLNDAIYDVSWYLYPVKLEKLVPLMLMHAEKPAKFESVGGLDCSLETLKTVTTSYALIKENRAELCKKNSIMVILFVQIIKCGYTFFMALRGL